MPWGPPYIRLVIESGKPAAQAALPFGTRKIMANEYGELEQLVNDVTSLDTARMTLRWALERLNNIEKEKADLKKGLALAEETAKKLQAKEASLQDVYSSRSKTLEEKEDFYTKLEATMSLLGEGKLDIQQLLKKEAKLDSLRRSLETEYEDKFAELDRNQRSIIERWNARLLEVESQYAGRLAEAQKKYDSLRSELEAEHQGRLTELQASFRHKEGELSGRIAFLESSVRESGEKVETRRRELEAEYLSKKRENEDNYRKLSNLLKADLEEKLRAMDSDHAAQITSLEASWQAERARLLEEQRVREDQFLVSQARIKELENSLASQQEAHHSELLNLISGKEAAFRARLTELEAEKAAKEDHVRELTAALEKRAAAWEEERGRVKADFERRAAAMEAALKEREEAMEKGFAARREELQKASFSGREDLEKEFEASLAAERRALDAEKSRMGEDRQRLEAALGTASDRISSLENSLAAAREDAQKELLGRISASEASFREKLAAFEAEKNAFNDKLAALDAVQRGKEAAFEKREADLEAEYKVRQESYAKEHAAEIEGARKDAESRLETERGVWKSERERFERTFEEISARFREAQLEIVGMNAELRKAAEEATAREAAVTRELLDAKFAFEKELPARVSEAVAAQTASLVEAIEVVKAEKIDLAAVIVAKEGEIKELKDSAARNSAEIETRLLAEYSDAIEAKRAEIAKSYASMQAALEEDLRQRRAAMEKEGSVTMARLSQENAAMKDALEKMNAAAGAANAKSAELSEKLLAAEKAFHAEKLEMQKQYARELEGIVASTVDAAVEASEGKLSKALGELDAARNANRELKERLLAAEKAYHDEKLEMQKEQVREMDSAVSDAVAAAVEEYAQRLRRAQEDAAKAQKEARGDMGQLEEIFSAEKQRLLDDIDRRDSYIEKADLKIQELENEMLKYRQEASSELMRNIAEQDARFRGSAAEEKARSEERIRQLEELVSAKEKLLAESDRFYRARQMELDGIHASLNMRINEFNKELFARKQELSDKEKELNDLKLSLETEHSEKVAELERMKSELAMVIKEYRSRK